MVGIFTIFVLSYCYYVLNVSYVCFKYNNSPQTLRRLNLHSMKVYGNDTERPTNNRPQEREVEQHHFELLCDYTDLGPECPNTKSFIF